MEKSSELITQFIKELRERFSKIDLTNCEHLLAEGRINQKQANVLTWEAKGGNCPRCGRPWKQSSGTLITFFEPDCTCYPRCRICNRWLVFEVAGKIDRCLHCGYLYCEEIVDREGKLERCGGKLILIGAMSGRTSYQCDSCGSAKAWEIVC